MLGNAEYDLKVVQKMRETGGDFIKALAEAFAHADHSNFQILKTAFPQYWSDYSKKVDADIERAGEFASKHE